MSSRSLLPLGVVIVLILVLCGFAWLSLGHGLFSPASSTTATTTQEYLQDGTNAYNANDFVDAINDANAVLAQDPNDVSALVAKAAFLAQEGSITFQENEYGTQAIAVAQQALALDPTNADAWRVRQRDHARASPVGHTRRLNGTNQH